MFSTIRRHQGWLFVLISAVVILSFVAFGPNSCNDIKLGGSGGGALGNIGDHIITQAELLEARRELDIRAFLNTQQWPKDANFPNRDDYVRVFIVQKEKQFGISVGPDAMADYCRSRILGNARFGDFVDRVLKPVGLTADDFERFLRHEIGIQQLVSTAGVAGKLVTPGEAETMFREDNQELACSMILYSASNFMAGVMVTNDALRQFYTNRMSVYREPVRMQVNYVKFNVTNYWDESVKALTNLDSRLDTEMKAAGTNMFGKAKTPEDSRAALRDYIIRTNALATANRDANAFANELYDIKPQVPANLETLAKTKGLILKTTQPFDEVEGPTNLDVLFNFPKQAFQLTHEEPFGGAIPEQDGVYVIGFAKTIPSRVPPLEEIQARVTDEYRYFEASLLAQQFAAKNYESLINGMAQGKTFAAVAAQMGLKPESLPPISLETQKLPDSIESRVSLTALKTAAFSTEVGHLSLPARAMSGVFLLYVEKKVPMDEEKVKAGLPAFLAHVRQVRQSETFNMWFSSQVQLDPSFGKLLRQYSEEPAMRSAAARGK